MILLIKTDTMDAFIGVTDGSKVLETKTWPAGRKLSMELLPEIEALLGRQRTAWQQLTGVVVFRGPGSFTGLRIGAAVANAISYGLKLPIVGAEGEGWIDDGLIALHGTKPGKFVMPHYGAEANITKPKK